MPTLNRRTFVQASGLVLALPAIWNPSEVHASEDSARPAAPERPHALDRIGFGDAASESLHALAASGSSMVAGALAQPARTLDPKEPAEVWGGTMRFRMKVDPARTTYVSVKLWGEDFGSVEQEWRLQLFVDGKAVGWFEQGPVDSLDQNSVEPRIAGQFYVHSIPLPEKMTAGKHELELEIRSLGRLWSYGNADNYYRAMTTPTRPIYAAYTHVDAYFVPASDDPFGAPAPLHRRADDSEYAVALVRERVLEDQRLLLHGKPSASIDPWAWMTLALGYGWKDGPAYRSDLALTKICEAIDANYLAWKANDAVLTASGQQWLGFGRVALALDTLWSDIEPLLAAKVTQGSTSVPNPGFEAGTAGWSVQKWRGTGTVVPDEQIFHSGAGSIRVTADPAAGGSVVGVTLGSGSRPLVGTGSYAASVWCRTDAVSGVGPYLDVLFYDAAGAVVQSDRKFHAAGGTHDWEQITATLAVPANAAAIRIDLRVEGAGTAWFDDVELVQTEGEPPQFPDMPVRRDAYREMLLASREYWRQNQRHYTNQVQFTSLGIYLCNKGLELLSPADAWPDERAREWIYEAVGLLPLSSGENADGSKKWKLGRNYRIYSARGLSRELGYVGGYGEITGDLLTGMYEAVTRGAIRREDEKLRTHVEACLEARGWFRHEGFGADGERVMRLESVVGWRNEHYSGLVVYATPTDKDVNPMQAASVFPSHELVGWTQEMIDDGQFGPILETLHTDRSSRIGLNAARFLIHDLPAFLAAAPSAKRLPAGWGQPDFLFTDATTGVLAVKRGDEVLYASLYWRARQAVNSWSRVHLLRPDAERSATVRSEVEFGSAPPVGTFAIQDWVCWDYTINDSDGNGLFPGGFAPPGPAIPQAFAGEELPIAATPAGMDPKLGATATGVEAVESGRAPFYRLSYAGYHIAMNTTEDQTFAYKCPATGRGIDCATGREVALPKQRWVGPGETVVLFDPSSRD